MDDGFMNVLESMRSLAGFKFHVTSAYRCPKHDQAVSKGGTGAHTTGKAIDIAVDRKNAFKLMQMLGGYPFTGIGIKQHGNGRFIHLDMINEDDESPYDGRSFFRPTIWSYK